MNIPKDCPNCGGDLEANSYIMGKGKAARIFCTIEGCGKEVDTTKRAPKEAKKRAPKKAQVASPSQRLRLAIIAVWETTASVRGRFENASDYYAYIVGNLETHYRAKRGKDEFIDAFNSDKDQSDIVVKTDEDIVNQFRESVKEILSDKWQGVTKLEIPQGVGSIKALRDILHGLAAKKEIGICLSKGHDKDFPRSEFVYWNIDPNAPALPNGKHAKE